MPFSRCRAAASWLLVQQGIGIGGSGDSGSDTGSLSRWACGLRVRHLVAHRPIAARPCPIGRGTDR